MSFVSRNHPQQIAVRGALDDVDDRGTKPEFIASLEERFGAFDLDVAAAAHNAKAPTYYTREDDGLTRQWLGQALSRLPPRRVWRGRVVALPVRLWSRGHQRMIHVCDWCEKPTTNAARWSAWC
jgi:hypothetical protein